MSDFDESKKGAKVVTACAAVAIFLWAWTGPCFAAGSHAIGSMPYLTFACAVGIITGLVLHTFKGHNAGELFRLPAKVFVSGFFGIAVYTVMLVLAVGMAEEADLGQVVLINYLWPIWMVLFSIILLDEKVRIWPAAVGAAAGFLGVVMVRGMDTFSRSPASLLPHAMALVGGMMWSLYSVLLKKWHVPEENNGSTLQFIFCGMLAAIVGIFNGQWKMMGPVTGTTILWILFLGIGPIGIAYYCWEIGVRRGSTHLIAVLAYFIPIMSAILIGVLFKRAFSWGLLPGAAMITAGALLSRKAVN